MAFPTKSKSISSSLDLADAFGWSQDQLASRQIRTGKRRISLQASKIEGEGAVVFTHIGSRATYDDLNVVSLYGYHASCPWGVVADEQGVHLLSSKWLRHSEWYRLPPIAWRDVPKAAELLEAFAPEGVRDSAPYRRLLKVEEPTGFLREVDDALVERLDSWRDRAVRYSRGAVSKVDEHLQTLYAQLFVLRTVEDRALDASIPAALSAYVSPEQFDLAQWEIIFEKARSQIGSDLFADNVALTMDPFILSGIVHDLYFPKKHPWQERTV